MRLNNGDQIMNMHLHTSFKRHCTSWLLGFLHVFLLASLSASCAHQPRNIDRYIQALERPERDEYQQPDKVIEALALNGGIVVADVGAGSGYFTRRLAQAVGETGQIIAVDVEQKMLNYNKQELEKLGIADRATFILAKPNDPSLPENSVDLIFLCNVYHHVEKQGDYFAGTKSALAPDGRVVIVDFYHDERSGKLGFSKHHLVSRERVITNMEQAGYILSKEHTFLSRQYFLEFVKTQ
jgi:ubiquinone/menaquinone biosynthesis C-methylase UbiE